jgi:HEAT repeat protein
MLSAAALLEIGPGARTAIPALITLLNDDNPYTAAAAQEALQNISRQYLGSEAEAWQKWWEAQQ